MKIVSIFADRLFAFHYNDEMYNEYDRLMDLWIDVGYLHAYAKQNNVKDVSEFINDILQNTEEIQDVLDKINQTRQPYRSYFEPLQESERKKSILPFQKGKIRKNQLRLYAIKLDDNCFVITGGAIKMSQKMEEHPDTAKELVKLNNARSYLNQNGVIDEDSFFELLSENI